MSKHNDSPGLAFRCNAPHLEHAPSFGRDGRLRDSSPIRLVLHGIARELQDKIRQPQGDEKIEDAYSQKDQKRSHLSRLPSEDNDEMGMPLK
jgi:hypothetical protein